ncbi:MAG: hypothetical protein ABIJ27_02900 [Candidatus Omnitrophota bacterium]
MRSKLKEFGRDDIEVKSAGTGTMDGMEPTFETISVMRLDGINVASHRSAVLTDSMIRKAGLILVMENMHRREIIRRVSEAREKTALLTCYGRAPGEIDPKTADIADPIGRPLDDYQAIYAQIKQEIERIMYLL